MRWMFLIVLALNLAYIAWQMVLPATESYAKVRPLKNVQPVVLLSELKQQQTNMVTAELEAEPELESKPVPGLQSIEAEKPRDEKDSDEQESTIVDAEKLQQVAEITADEELEEARQAGLTKDNKVIADVKLLETQKVPQATLPQKESCFTLGPFRDLEKLRGLTREIKPYVVTTDFRGQEEQEQPLYWVYIKPEKNRKTAIETGKRLKAKKIRDFFVIREGEKNNGISLGYYRNKNGAYRLTKKVKKLGFDVTVEQVFKTYTIYWLDYQLASGTNIPEAIFEKYIKSAKKGKVSQLKRECVN